MKKVFILSVFTLLCVPLFSQGFKKSSSTEKIGSYEAGNYHLYKHSSDSVTIYSFTLRDQKYSTNTFLRVWLGTKEDAIEFLKNVIETIDQMKKGDTFDLGLPDGNTGFYSTVLGIKILGITVGDLGEFGQLSKGVAKSMLKRMEKEK